MYQIRENEPDYAFVPRAEAPETNRYGKPVELASPDDPRVADGLVINGERSCSDNPNRLRQHGFYFNADNCISCHACESACSLKNDLPPHLAYRAVGYVEGGTWPAYRRLNISMACNHCDNPVCLKGCPTRAYTKLAEYGAVLQDPDICFGCGYCTWVCPYNAPQLDTTRGHVHKCNMCIDRLEVGLKPACAAACLAGALDFGVIETTPENRTQLETAIPGFPDPSITHPNIRFQQTRSLPDEMHRPDAAPVRYVRDGETPGRYRPEAAAPRRAPGWNLRGLRSREDPLVVFTLLTQLVAGTFLLLFLGPMAGLEELAPGRHPLLHGSVLFALVGLQTLALALSTFHLGRPHRFYRAFNNLRYSPVSREVAGIAVFFNLLAAYTLLTTLPDLFAFLPAALLAGLRQATGWGAAVAGVTALWLMHRIYRIRARPYWNHWQVLTSFYGAMLSLGSATVALAYGAVLWQEGTPAGALLSTLALVGLTGLALEALGAWRHDLYLRRSGGEAAAALRRREAEFGRAEGLRRGLAAVAFLLLGVIAAAPEAVSWSYPLWLLAAVTIVLQELVGRALFYVLVVPTTMPGAFFWRNAAFQAHARSAGLADMPQVGVVADTH